jgi:AraC family transcriptional regulator
MIKEAPAGCAGRRKESDHMVKEQGQDAVSGWRAARSSMSNGRGVIQGLFGRAVLVELDRSVIPHVHPHCHVLINSSEVDTVFRVSGREYPLTKDVAVLVNSWEPHGFAHSPGAPTCAMLGLYIDVDWLADVDPSFGLSGSRHFFPNPCRQLPSRMRLVAHQIAEQLRYGITERNAYEPLLLALMIEVIEKFSVWRELRYSQPAQQPKSLEVSDFRVRRALSFIREHLNEPCSMGQVARACGLSRSHFFELFAKALGMTPHVYYSALRMEAAYKALPHKSITLGQLASQIGFSAPSHFTRFFNQNLGIPPREYRRLLAK